MKAGTALLGAGALVALAFAFAVPSRKQPKRTWKASEKPWETPETSKCFRPTGPATPVPTPEPQPSAAEALRKRCAEMVAQAERDGESVEVIQLILEECEAEAGKLET